MPKIPDKMLDEIWNCATVNELEVFRNLINQKITDNDLRLSCIGALGARYFDIYYFEQLTGIYYPESSLN